MSPSPHAASTDTTRIVRADYATDAVYTRLALSAIRRWRQLNLQWKETVYHETGLLLLTEQPMEQCSYELSSFAMMQRAGQQPQRCQGAEELRRRWPLHAESGRYMDGYYNPNGGWVDNGRAMELLTSDALQLGVRIVNSAQVLSVEGDELQQETGTGRRQARRLVTTAGAFDAELFIFCCGAWTPSFFPSTASLLRASAQPCVYLSPPAAALQTFASSTSFPVCAAGLSQSGYYFFPLSTRSPPTVKVAHHGPGLGFDSPASASPLTVPEAVVDAIVSHITAAVPALRDCTVSGSRVCWYCDSRDGDWLLDWEQQWDGLFLCAGDSGHAFKFAPVIRRAGGEDPLQRRGSQPERGRGGAGAGGSRELERRAAEVCLAAGVERGHHAGQRQSAD